MRPPANNDHRRQPSLLNFRAAHRVADATSRPMATRPQLRKELLALDGDGSKKHAPNDLALGLALAVWGFTGAGEKVGEQAAGRLF